MGACGPSAIMHTTIPPFEDGDNKSLNPFYSPMTTVPMAPYPLIDAYIEQGYTYPSQTTVQNNAILNSLPIQNIDCPTFNPNELLACNIPLQRRGRGRPGFKAQLSKTEEYRKEANRRSAQQSRKKKKETEERLQQRKAILEEKLPKKKSELNQLMEKLEEIKASLILLGLHDECREDG
ncbi:hypothetical protein G9A89_003795 [Geosiphon pyriformis]|nr:hypothetical protein G9A89_003795 [Geosiphon pyriformis]